MPVSKLVTKYIAALNPNTGIKLNGSITLRCQDGYSLVVSFLDTTDPLPTNNYNSLEKKGTVYRRIDQYPFYVDLLRNEGPITVLFVPESTPPVFTVHTGDEPPGEGET